MTGNNFPATIAKAKKVPVHDLHLPKYAGLKPINTAPLGSPRLDEAVSLTKVLQISKGHLDGVRGTPRRRKDLTKRVNSDRPVSRGYRAALAELSRHPLATTDLNKLRVSFVFSYKSFACMLICLYANLLSV